MREKIVSFLKRIKKTEILAAAICLMLTAAVTGSLAYLKSETTQVENTFELVGVPNEVLENLNGNQKNNVRIKNNSDSEAAYIRATVVATWVKLDSNGKPTSTVYGEKPVENVDYSIAWTKDDWKEYPTGSGVYYYGKSVKPEEQTGELFANCAPIILSKGKTLNQPDGYQLSIEIMAQSIQADGTDENGNKPIELAWGVDIVDRKVVPATIAEEGGNQ